jgi:hypothetical protein
MEVMSSIYLDGDVSSSKIDDWVRLLVLLSVTGGCAGAIAQVAGLARW